MKINRYWSEAALSASCPAAVVVLAAGEGTRMRSAIPKPLHQLAGRSLLGHALTAAQGLDPDHVVVVVRHQAEAVAEHAEQLVPGVIIAHQDSVPGTGRAVQCALQALDAATDEPVVGTIVVLPADCPMVNADVLTALSRTHTEQANAVTILTAEVADSTGYGRIIRDGSPTKGLVEAIVEELNASPEQRQIKEINSSIYVFDGVTLRQELGGLDQNNAQHEVLLTDVIAAARRQGRAARALLWPDPWVIEGVNDRVQLARLGREFNRRQVEAAMRTGVTIQDPATTWIDVEVKLSQDVTLLRGTHLQAGTKIASGAWIGPDSTLCRTEVGQDAKVDRTHAVDAVIGAGAVVGPWTHLRPGTVLGVETKAGSFCEIKAADIGKGAKVPHLSYVGDATIGEGSNIGAASIFANYDGVAKARTTIGRHVKIGSDTVLIAPVTVGDGAYTGAGSLIKDDVPPGALSVNGFRQRIIEDWVERRRPGTLSAQVAGETFMSDEVTSETSSLTNPNQSSPDAVRPPEKTPGREPPRPDHLDQSVNHS